MLVRTRSVVPFPTGHGIWLTPVTSTIAMRRAKGSPRRLDCHLNSSEGAHGGAARYVSAAADVATAPIKKPMPPARTRPTLIHLQTPLQFTGAHYEGGPPPDLESQSV